MHLETHTIRHSRDAEILLELLDQTRAAVVERLANLKSAEGSERARVLQQKRLIRAVQMAVNLGGDASACRKASFQYKVWPQHLEYLVGKKMAALEREARSAKHRKVRGLHASGCTPTQIAARVGYSRSYVSQIINGHTRKNKWLPDL